ncbi:sensor histidine kinase [Curtobacterium herbarum]|uniref:histidine kinase n=1 Tax=Curtobacterium herbarum TaxID=150122 RepID=A0ABN1ZDI8_9MICO|nr:histidine kinase [Curtobacterium herbarum]MBM7475478.1 signal transduction histidine kinase [Curtobacterium herbarum]MCS6543394.1 histidine kinase [Curtobacterium herbarum]
MTDRTSRSAPAPAPAVGRTVPGTFRIPGTRLRASRSVVLTRGSLVVAAVTLLAVGAPVAAVVHGVPVPLALLVTAVLSGTLLVAPARPRSATAVHLLALAGLGVLTAPGTVGPWPLPVTAMIGLAVLLVVLGLRTGWRTTAVAWGTSTVLTLVLVAATPCRWAEPEVWVSTLVVSSGSGLLIGAAAVLLGQRRSVGAELVAARQDAEQQAGARRAVEERARIARELHDVVAHSMSVVHMQAESAPYRVSDLPPAARAEFRTIAETSRTALREMRQLLGTLRGEDDAERAPQPGLSDLPALVASTRAAGLAVTLDVGGDGDSGDTGAAEVTGAADTVGRVTQLTVYRVVQEALGNVVRHAPGADTIVLVRVSTSAVAVTVTNAPVPLAPPPPADDGGYGLAGMRSRVAALDGTLDADPTADGGFRVAATLPRQPDGDPR